MLSQFRMSNYPYIQNLVAKYYRVPLFLGGEFCALERVERDLEDLKLALRYRWIQRMLDGFNGSGGIQIGWLGAIYYLLLFTSHYFFTII